jgi:hypothetical protein
MNKARYDVALCVAVLGATTACAGDDAPPERYRSVGDRRDEPREVHDAAPAGPICGEGKTYPGYAGAEACALDLPPANSLVPIDRHQVNVIISFIGAERTWAIPKIKDAEGCGSERAWHFDQADEPSQIILCPEACAFAVSDGDSSFQVLIGCGDSCYDDDAGCDFPLI